MISFGNPCKEYKEIYDDYKTKSAGQGNSHESKMKPNGTRVGYADALARECNNPWAAAYVRTILQKEPDIMEKTFLGKSGDLTWYRCTTKKALPKEGHTLAELPMAKVFNETGIGTMNTSLGDIDKNAMLSFRSSSYGSTSHALANQNAFNTFYGGKAIFYSSGHRTGFTDDHCMYSYRNTRAHNSILVNGMTQKIGTEGYGWIPRWYEGEKIAYMVGDASNAYGKVTSPLWLKRGELSGTQYTPEKGWDENKLNMFRRHIIQLGSTGVFVIYDELEGKEAVTWGYLLHTVELPMEIQELTDEVKVTGRNKAGGISVAHLFSSAKTEQAMVDTFFCAPTNWKNVTNAQGKAVKYPNHWHFSSTTVPCKTARFLTVMDTHGDNRPDMQVVRKGNIIQVGDWTITCNLTEKGKAAIHVSNKVEKVSLNYDAGKKEGATTVTDQVKEVPGLQRAVSKVEGFVTQIEILKSKSQYIGVGKLIEEIIETVGYSDYIDTESESDEQATERRQNIDELISKAVQYEETVDEPSLSGFLEEVALVADIDNLDENNDMVSLMTIHSAKGLEFPIVYLAGMEDGLFPSYMSISTGDESDIEEERRLCYVGITRAKETLIMSAARMRTVRGETQMNRTSRFVREIPKELLAESAQMLKKNSEYSSITGKDHMELPVRKRGQVAFNSYQREAISNTVFDKKTDSAPDYVVGDRVRHIKFGEGTVADMINGGRDYEVTVDFDTAGRKKMFAGFAKLVKI